MSEELKKMIEALDAKIEKLGSFVNFYANGTEKKIVDGRSSQIKAFKAIEDLYKQTDALKDAVRTIAESADNHRIKYNDLYYHVFPERLAQDSKLIDQLEALKSKPSPDAHEKKS